MNIEATKLLIQTAAGVLAALPGEKPRIGWVLGREDPDPDGIFEAIRDMPRAVEHCTLYTGQSSGCPDDVIEAVEAIYLGVPVSVQRSRLAVEADYQAAGRETHEHYTAFKTKRL